METSSCRDAKSDCEVRVIVTDAGKQSLRVKNVSKSSDRGRGFVDPHAHGGRV